MLVLVIVSSFPLCGFIVKRIRTLNGICAIQIHSFILLLLLLLLFLLLLLLLLLLIIIIIINWRIVKDRENPFLAIFRQGCPQFYDFIFGQTIFLASDCTAKNQP